MTEFREVFPTDFLCMPSDRDIDFWFVLELDTRPISIHLYHMALAELRELKDQIQDFLDKGFIQPSSSRGGPNCCLLRKKWEYEHVYRLRQSNRVSIHNKYPLLWIDDLFNQLQGASVFSKIDMRSGYNQLKIRPEVWARLHLELAMGNMDFCLSFGLTYVPAAFTSLMDGVFNPFHDSFVIIFIDDILVYSKSEEKNQIIFVFLWVFLENKHCMQKIASVNFCLILLHFWGM